MNMAKIKVLFLCVHNSARSQMAEAFLKKYGEDRFAVESAGFEPGILNPVVVEVMKEIDIDISGNKTQGVFDLVKQGKLFDYVVTVCDESNAERCPIFPGITRRLHWSFDDPSAFTGTLEEKMQKTRVVRDKIENKIMQWLKSL
jgi:arsenate reductase